MQRCRQEAAARRKFHAPSGCIVAFQRSGACSSSSSSSSSSIVSINRGAAHHQLLSRLQPWICRYHTRHHWLQLYLSMIGLPAGADKPASIAQAAALPACPRVEQYNAAFGTGPQRGSEHSLDPFLRSSYTSRSLCSKAFVKMSRFIGRGLP